MNQMLTCTACDAMSWDVRTTIVETDSSETTRVAGVDGQTYEVPVRFRAEPRCTDPEACRSRQEATGVRG